MRSLLWKEWHEQRWKLGFGCLVLGAFAVIGLRSRIVDDVTIIATVCVMGLGLLPVLSSMGMVPAEREEGTWESLIRLPIARWKILLSKTLIGVCLCVGPLIAAAALSLVVAGGREARWDAICSMYALALLSTISLFFWQLAVTIRMPTETRAGLLGLGIVVFWVLATVGVWFEAPHGLATLSPYLFVAIGRDEEHASARLLAAGLVVQPAIAVLLWVLALRSAD